MSTALDEFVIKYGPRAGERGPEQFVREVFGAEPDEWQVEVLRAYGRNAPRISVASCHGPGKTAVLAWMIWHQLCTRFPQKTACTAPTKGQLEDALIAEVKVWYGKFAPVIQSCFEPKADRIEMIAHRAASFATFKTARPEQPEALQGVHAPWVLLIADESSGVPEQVFEAAIGSMTGQRATTVLAGNPVRTQGLFFDSQNRLASEWFTVQVSAVDRPGAYTSKRISPVFVEWMKQQYGEDSNAYRVRVLGLFPRADDDTIIAYELLEGASGRDIKVMAEWSEVWGLDVARFGWCMTALAKRKGNILREPVRTWQQLDLMQVVGVVKAEWDATPPSERPVDICVDAIGLGAGVADRLRELGLPARAINVSEVPAIGAQYQNLRTELWFKAQQWFGSRSCSIPPEPKAADPDRSTLQQELARTKYKVIDSNGRMRAESKDEMRKRGFRSPDKADAFVLTFASIAATALGGGPRRSWNQSVARPNTRAA